MNLKSENDEKLEHILNKYKLTSKEREEFLNIIKIIYIHDEFQRRMTSEFKHHGKITLGVHILEDAVVTYKLSKKYMKKKKEANYNMDLAVKISMLHDLYTLPWQNNKESRSEKFFNLHGFRHPIESVINANAWYPELFEGKDSKILIDGIVHHMYPLPVSAFEYDKNNKLELKNFDLINKLSERNIQFLTESSKRNKIGIISLSKSIYREGMIMSKADKRVSINQIKNFGSLVALITGRNKNLERAK